MVGFTICGRMPPNAIPGRHIPARSSSASCIEQELPVFATMPFLEWPGGVQLNDEDRSLGESNVSF